MKSTFLKFFAIVLAVALTFVPCGFSQISSSCSSSPYLIGCGAIWMGEGVHEGAWKIAIGGTLGNLIVVSDAHMPDMPAVYTVFHNGVATSLSCTVGPHPTDPTANNSAECFDQNASHYFSVSPGDSIQSATVVNRSRPNMLILLGNLESFDWNAPILRFSASVIIGRLGPELPVAQNLLRRQQNDGQRNAAPQ